MFSDHNEIKLEISNSKVVGKSQNTGEKQNGQMKWNKKHARITNKKGRKGETRTENPGNKQKTNTKTVDLNPNILISTLKYK